MKNLSPKHIIIAAMAVSATVLSSQAFASGYAIREVSPSLLGNAYAGISTSDEDISAIAYNPATLAMIEDNAFYISGTGIFPGISAHSANATTNVTLGPGVVDPLPANGTNSVHHIGKDAFVPAAFLAWNMSEAVKLGLAVTAPWGLATQYDDDWAGRYFAVDTEIESVNINPMASFSFNEHFSVGAGFQAQYLRARLSQANAVPVNVNPNPPPPVFEVFDLRTEVKGHGWGYGWNVGALYEFNEDTRIGAGYISKITTTIEGDSEAEFASPFPSPVEGPVLVGLASGDAQTDITTPEKINLGISHDLTDEWTVMADVEWTHWSRFKDLVIDIDNNEGSETTSSVIEDWENTWFYALGTTYTPNKTWVFRGGAFWDESPVQDQYRNPTLPDSDRFGLAVGAGYNFTPCLRVDLAYNHIFFKSASIDLDDVPVAEGESKSMEADYNGHADIVSLGLSWEF